jgi:ubiquinone/menaquinone biosynthesis C-methylase UbiE
MTASPAKTKSRRSGTPGSGIKRLLGELPFTAEISQRWLHPNARPSGGFALKHADKHLDEWVRIASAARLSPVATTVPKRILFFTTLRYWTEHAILISAALAGQGHQVTLAYLPVNNWKKPANRFDQRRSELYVKNILNRADALFRCVSFSDLYTKPSYTASAIPASLVEALQQVSIRDVQYTRQVEEIAPGDPLYHYRLECNTRAAKTALALLQTEKPDLLITPNGSILEMGAVYQAARHLGIPAVTYEYGEQRGRIWLAQNEEVMQQNTAALWESCRAESLSQAQWEQIRALAASRQGARLWENFSRLWQDAPTQGGEQVRQALGLDDRPLVLLPANVIGDSLTLGRQIFSESMTDWLLGTVRYFVDHPEAQLVVRIHPGERYTSGPSVADVLRSAFPGLGADPTTQHIHLVAASDPVNTYDLIETADLGLVYTTTTGLEAAMSGLPVIAAGQTHYRGKGFTLDPLTWQEYRDLLDQALANPQALRPSREQVELAWTYAYRFFFDYPLPFPWHMVKFWKDLQTWPLERLLTPEGQAAFGTAFSALTGGPMHSKAVSIDDRSPVEPATRPVAAAEAGLTTKQQVRQFYDQIGWQKIQDAGSQAEIYENALYEDLRPVSADYIRKCRLRILRHLLPSGQILLDAGSGPVQYPEYIEYSRGYKKRLCMDISMLALIEARKRLGDHGDYVVADIANLPFKKDAFDGVVSLHTIHHLPQDEHLMAYSELTRVLKPEKVAVVVVGWRKPLMTRILNAPHRLQKWLKNKRKAFSRRSASKRGGAEALLRPEQAAALANPYEQDGSAGQPKGTFVDKYNAAWLKQGLAACLPAGAASQLLVWRSLGGRTLRMYIHPRLGGRAWLRLLYRLEERFPRFFGENGAYPMIILSKPTQETDHAR